MIVVIRSVRTQRLPLANAVKILSESIAKALAAADVVAALVKQGVEPGYAAPADLDAFLKADAALWSKLVKELGIKPQ